MIKRHMGKMIFLALVSIMMSTMGFCSAMPNPIVKYQSYDDAVNAVGFMPLYLPKISGYSCNYISVIGNKMADLGFQKQGEVNSKLRVRTALQASFSSDDISGIYSVTWDHKNIDDTDISIAKINENSYAAHWKTGKYLFSVQAEEVSYSDFMSLLSDALVDLSAYYYR